MISKVQYHTSIGVNGVARSTYRYEYNCKRDPSAKFCSVLLDCKSKITYYCSFSIKYNDTEPSSAPLAMVYLVVVPVAEITLNEVIPGEDVPFTDSHNRGL